MKTAIIFSGNTKTTELVANILKKELKHDVDIFDTSKRFYIDFDEYDNFILGTNVKYGRLNARFVKCLKIMKKYTTENQNYYVYITGAYTDSAEDYIKKARLLIEPTICDYYFVGGEIDTSNMKGINKLLANHFLRDLTKNGKESPKLIFENIDKLIESINNFEGNKNEKS